MTFGYRTAVVLLLFSVTLLLAVGGASAGIVIDVPADYPTIQAGIDAAVSGDTVRVASGTYTGVGNRNIKFHDKSIVLESAAGANATTIDCEGVLRGLFISNEEIVAPGIQGQDILDRAAGVDAELVIDGFTITNGSAWAGAGIVVSNGNHPIIKNCRINNCTAGFAGGGIFVGDGAFPTFINCVITENAAPNGGGVRVGDDVNSTFIDCTISENTATRGGGVDATDHATSVFRNCDISGNQAATGGGFAVSDLSEPTLEDCTITGNQGDNGGGLKISNDSTPDINGCTIAANHAVHDGGGLYVVGASIAVTMTIVWGNCAEDSGDQVYVSDGETVSFACGDVDSAGVAGAGQVFYDASTIFVDPLFCEAILCTSAPTAAGDYTLDDDSQALAAASPCGDLIGAQPQGCTERSFGVGDEGQFAKIQDAIDQTVSGVGDVVVVASGTWDGPRNTELDFGGKNIVLKASGPAVIDGGGSVRAIVFKNGEDSTSEVQGFTLTGGDPTKPGSAVFVSGGASPIFSECTIKDNDSDAGVVCVESGTPIFKFCTVEQNTSSSATGVLDFVGGNPRLMSSVVRNNSATNAVTISTPTQVWQSEITDNSGCGVYLDVTTTSLVIGSDISRNGDRGVVINNGSASFADVTFRENAGGGVVVTGMGSGGAPAPASDSGTLPQTVSGSTDFVSCEFSGHSADRGAGFFFDCTNEPEIAYTVTFADCRFTGNHATFEGGAVAICGRATNADITPIFTACTIAANSAQDGGGIYMGVEEVGIGRLAQAQVDQTILWGNCSTVSPQGEAFVLAGNEVAFNCSHAGVDQIGGTGLIAATDMTTGVPGFCDYPGFYYASVCDPIATTEGNFNLSPGSPAAPQNHPCGPDQVGAFPVDFCLPTGIGDRAPQMQTTLRSPAPNPFNPATTVEFVLDARSQVTLTIYDVQGRLVRTLVDREMQVGVHRPEWDGRDERGKPAASGVYFVRFEAGQTVQTQKLVLVK